MKSSWKRVSCHGNGIFFIAVGVFPVELFDGLCCDISIYILDIKLG